VSGAVGYAVYRNISGSMSLIAFASGTAFNDIGPTQFSHQNARDWMPSAPPHRALLIGSSHWHLRTSFRESWQVRVRRKVPSRMIKQQRERSEPNLGKFQLQSRRQLRSRLAPRKSEGLGHDRLRRPQLETKTQPAARGPPKQQGRVSEETPRCRCRFRSYRQRVAASILA
jgi:hypothetical protein